jgi:integration host factor subunit alpha
MTAAKSDLIHAVADANGSPLKRSVEIIEILLELEKTKLASGEDVLISGFGKFCVREKRHRRGRNSATGKDMMLEARSVVTFKCSRQLRDKINKTRVHCGACTEGVL